MVCMATGASRLAGATILAVKAGIRLDISSDFLVTIETECALLTAVEASMAVVAVLLVFCMRCNDLARHDQRFDLGSGRGDVCKVLSNQKSEQVSGIPNVRQPVSVDVNREYMNESGQHHQDADRQMENVPDGE